VFYYTEEKFLWSGWMHIPEIGFRHSNKEPAEFEMIDIQSLHGRTLAHSPDNPHRISFFMLLYIEEGEGNHMVDFQDYAFRPGSFLFIQREQVHSFDFSTEIKGKAIVFTQDFLDQVHANMRLPNYTPTHLNSHHTPLVKLNDDDNSRCQNLIEEITNELAHRDSDPLIVMYLFSSLSLMLHRLRPELRHDKLSHEQSSKFARFLELLFDHFKKIRDANWYANQVNTTYKTLNQVCKLATDMTAKQLIDAYTVIEIKRSLVVSNITTQQIAFDFGFEDASNFVKFFKKHTTMTPSKFQKAYLNPVL
jgi:AraC-like DNA-binding protein